MNADRSTSLPEILRAMDARLADMQGAVAEIRSIYEAHSKRLERLEHEVFGNGRSGLAVQVRAILWLSSAVAGFVALLVTRAISGVP